MSTIDRQRALGLAVGSLWLIVAGVAFGIWSLWAIDTTASRWVLGIALILTLALLVFGVSVAKDASRLPRSSAPRTPADRALALRFGGVVLVEIIAFAVVNPLVASRGHVELLPALNLGIVGLHFLPLAWLFKVPRYYVMGVLFCLIPAATISLMPADAEIGSALAWFVIPSLGCALVAVLTGAASLREANNSLLH